MPGGTFEDEVQEALGAGGGGATGTFEDEVQQALGGSGTDDGFKPYSGPAQVPLKASSRTPYMNPDRQDIWSQFLDTTGDAVQGLAGGTFSGLGVNPQQLLGEGVRSRLQLAQDRSPVEYGAGRLVGELGIQGAALPAGMSPIAMGAASGAMSGIGGADTEDWEGRLEALGGGAAIGGAMGGVFQGAGAAANKLAGMAPQLERQGLINRVGSSGVYGGDFRRMADNLGGEQGVLDLGRWMEGNGMGGVRDVESIRDTARGIYDTRVPDQLRFLDEADAAGANVDTGSVVEKLRGLGNEQAGLAPLEAESQAGMYGATADRLAEQSALGEGADSLQMPFSAAHANRVRYDAGVNYKQIGGPREDGLMQEVNRDAAGGLRQGLKDALPPDMLPEWQGIQQDIGNAAQVMRPADRRVWQEAGNQTLSLPTMIAAAGGGVAAPATMAAMAATKAYGKSALATGQGALARGLSGLGGPTSDFARSSASLTGNVAGERSAQATKQARGYLLPQAAMQALQGGGQELGEYAQQFAEAASSPDSGAIAALISRLTQSDPRFRQTVLPMLQAMTSEDG